MHKLQDLWDRLWAAVAANMTLLAAIGTGLYPVVMAIVMMTFLPAFRGGLVEMIGWLFCFATLNVLIVLAGRIKNTTVSASTGVFVLCCQLLLTTIVAGMAFSRMPEGVIKFFTFCQIVSLVFVQTSLWWTVRHQTEVFALWKAWFAKLFSRQPAAGSHVGSLNAPSGGGNNGNSGGGSAGGLPPPTNP